MARKKQPFQTEVELCAAFIKAVDERYWTAYAETGDWDIVLVRRADGFQVGIEAKLRLGTEVINQAIEKSKWYGSKQGPDCRAVLVPNDTGGFGRICAYIGITIITMRHDQYSRASFYPYLPSEAHGLNDGWHEWCPITRIALPEYVPDVPAGASAPVKLTEWKIAALKILITIDRRGFVTREDFAKHRIDHRRWLASESRWLIKQGGVWVAGPHLPDFRKDHPSVTKQIEADAEKWMPKVSAPDDLFMRRAG